MEGLWSAFGIVFGRPKEDYSSMSKLTSDSARPQVIVINLTLCENILDEIIPDYRYTLDQIDDEVTPIRGRIYLSNCEMGFQRHGVVARMDPWTGLEEARIGFFQIRSLRHNYRVLFVQFH